MQAIELQKNSYSEERMLNNTQNKTLRMTLKEIPEWASCSQYIVRPCGDVSTYILSIATLLGNLIPRYFIYLDRDYTVQGSK